MQMKHSVLITGSSTGIGFAAAVHLAKTHHVLAQVRKPQDGARLKAVNPEIDILQSV
jgi:NAD(P)-dependent dehydrogenase (short-subunit alcohol dehydrogenase family)